ncbi:Zinc finger and BTB domain-containing protein 7B [Apodemus speciosus]|uniref:Zinc finger and BTB domain-containing protein 7B n=1 Tax=Apodemus speciosus TaxID=105296 RepID=A0ABQ0FQZ6_APOSI
MGSPEDDLIGIPFPDYSSELLSFLNEQRQLGTEIRAASSMAPEWMSKAP